MDFDAFRIIDAQQGTVRQCLPFSVCNRHNNPCCFRCAGNSTRYNTCQEKKDKKQTD
jgi:hypothetical protein